MKRSSRLFSAAVLFAAVSCGPDFAPLTQMMVVVDSDLGTLAAVRVRVEGMGDPLEATASDLTKKPLPRTVAIVHRGGPLGPIVVTAEGLEAGEVVVSRRAELSFVRGRNLMLRLDLAASCVAKQCDDAKLTCNAGECGSSRVDEKTLDDWTGSAELADAGESIDADIVASDGGRNPDGSGGRGGAAGGGRGGSSGSAGSGGATGTGGGGGSGGAPPRTCTDCSFSAGVNTHGTLSCDDGTCRLTCEAGYTDADKARNNGCEAPASGFEWAPSNFDPLASSWTPTIADRLSVTCSMTVDLGTSTVPTTVTVCGQPLQPMVFTQANGGSELVVLAMRQLTVARTMKLRFTGARPVLLVVYGDAQIDGEIDVSAIGATGGAGSNQQCNPGAGGNGYNGLNNGAGGGGGGGLATGGAAGATTASGSQGGVAGATTGDSVLRPLRGGCPGGAGGKDQGIVAPGGAGGGGLQLSVAGTLRIAGVIAAAGGGGFRGEEVGDGGGGGGSGGAILLEATRIEVVAGGWITANGGGGGAGRFLATTRTSGNDGAHASSGVAAGGAGSTQGGDGGHGAAGQEAAAMPESPSCLTTSACGAGGGGGGLGRIVLRATECQLGGGTSPLVAACTGH